MDEGRQNENLVSKKAERALMGVLLRSPAFYWQVRAKVQATMFTEPKYAKIYGAFAEIMESKDGFSMTALKVNLGDDPDWSIQINFLYGDAVDNHAAMDWADTVAEKAARRRLMTIARSMLKKAEQDIGTTALDIAADAESALIEVQQKSNPKQPERLGQVMVQMVTAARTSTARDVGIITSFGPFDGLVGPILEVDLGFLIGSTADGKSALGEIIADHVSRQGLPTLTITMEMSKEQIAGRGLARASGISASKLDEGTCDAEDLDTLGGWANNLSEVPNYILDERRLTVRQIRAHALTQKRMTGLRLLVLDQLDKIKGDANRYKDKFERMAEVTGDLKDLAKELRVPIICLAQRTRQAVRRDDPVPQIDDTEAPTIERDADWVLALWRLVTWLRQHKPADGMRQGVDAVEQWKAKIENAANLAEFITLKHRRRQAFARQQVKWVGSRTLFEPF